MIHRNCARTLTALAAVVLLGGCAALIVRKPAVLGGELSGRLALAWDDGYSFVAYPVKGNELTYRLPKDHRLAGVLGEIRPQIMYTDGGSIPRTFWSFDGLSPWEYGPAFIIHDWIFSRHYCKKKDYPVTLAEANDILLDAMILLDAQVARRHGRRPHNAGQVRRLIDAAVTNFSKSVWDKGKCPPTPDEPFYSVIETKQRVETIIVAGRSKSVVRTERVKRLAPRYRFLFNLPTD
jgi:Protein of unknown function (DUF1353)